MEFTANLAVATDNDRLVGRTEEDLCISRQSQGVLRYHGSCAEVHGLTPIPTAGSNHFN